ncbi:lipopolysaccharide transport system permease protein [Catalinimonas alkaloidigena]|uniref:ABC transporter permease n=1 Tax=Catalinimonas alkaloidigena TaxID=1075417 RepID=UPI0024072215|nr:ABC transporter permease [Catalinimonas alkaloidigena]MDF9801108.1 lipopolysaccharide transport system permease protein [Catalinimonas alkaloidigena]
MANHKVIIDANKSVLSLDLKELFSYKDLFYTLAQRDFKVKYAQTFLGFAWAFIQPFMTLIVFALVFSRGLRLNTGEIPYILFAACGLAAWTYFSSVMNQAGNSIIGSQGMVQKIYFPRLIIPLSKALVGLIDFFIALLIIFLLLIFYQYAPSPNIIFLPFFILMAVIAALGVGIWLSALTIRYRDFQQIVPFLVRFGMFFTPVAYPASIFADRIPNWALIIYYLNPIAGVIDGFRWTVLGTDPPNILSYVSFFVVILLFISSLFYFKKVERTIADII